MLQDERRAKDADVGRDFCAINLVVIAGLGLVRGRGAPGWRELRNVLMVIATLFLFLTRLFVVLLDWLCFTAPRGIFFGSLGRLLGEMKCFVR